MKKTSVMQFLADVKKEIPYYVDHFFSRQRSQIYVRVYKVARNNIKAIEATIRKIEKRAYPNSEYQIIISVFNIAETKLFYPSIWEKLARREKRNKKTLQTFVSGRNLQHVSF